MILEPYDLMTLFRKPLQIKIILHRIISVVWLTNFLSEIRSLSSHDDETDLQFLSMKLIWKVTFQINFMLRNWSYTSSSWLDRLQISDRKFVNHTTEMILWSMILIWWVFLKLVFRSRGSNIIDAIASPFGRGSTKSNFLLVLSLDQDFAKELFLSNAIWVMYFIEK